MANHLDFLEVLDRHTRRSPAGVVASGYEMHEIAAEAGIVLPGDLSAARWTGELVNLGYLEPGARLGADRRVIPRGFTWTDTELQVFSHYRVTAVGRQEADRIRRLNREEAADIALGGAMPNLRRPWLLDGQRAALSRPIRDLEAALADGRAPAAIGAAKELVEATCKIVLEHRGVPVTQRSSLSSLFSAARRALGIEDAGLGRSLSATVQGLDDRRNAAGTGHGRADAPAVGAGEAQLAASAAIGLAEFLLDAASA